MRGADREAVWEAIKSCDPLWLVPSVLALGVSVFVRALRWRALFDPSRRPGIWPVTAATLVGYLFLQILPLRAGEAARIFALSQRSGTSKAEIAGTALLERVYDLVAVLGLLFVLLPWLPEVTWLRAAASLGAAVFVLVVIAVIVLAVWGDRAVHAVMRPFARLPVVPADRLEEIGHNLAQGLVGLRRPGLALWALFLSVASWVLLGLSFWFVFESFDLGVGRRGRHLRRDRGRADRRPAGRPVRDRRLRGVGRRRARGVRRGRVGGALGRARPARGELRQPRRRRACR